MIISFNESLFIKSQVYDAEAGKTPLLLLNVLFKIAFPQPEGHISIP